MKGLNVVVDFGIHGNVDFLPCLSPQDFYQLSYYAQCLKITKNVAFEFFNFCPIKNDLSGNTV